MCLLILLEKLAQEMELGLTVVHVNHHLRGEEADQDEAFVKEFCKGRGISCVAVQADVRGYAEKQGFSLEEAGRILFDNNPLTAITSQVCDWKEFCYGHCILNVKNIPIRWYKIEQEISDAYLFGAKLERESDLLKGKKIALIGAGPVGIAAAVWLYRAGAEVSLADANPRIGGVLRYGIPAFRLDRKYINAYERMIKDAGIEFQGGIEVGKDILLNRVAARYDAVLIGAGAEKPASLGIPGEAKGLQALPFLKNPEAFDLGRKVIVIGGGNVAMDASRTAARLGADTWIYYRKDFGNMPANPLEVKEAQRDGVHFKVFQAPVEVRDGSVIFCDCQNETDPETGRLSSGIMYMDAFRVSLEHDTSSGGLWSVSFSLEDLDDTHAS